MVEGESEGQSNESIESFEMNEVLFGELLNFGVTEPIARQALELTKNSSIEDALDMVQKLNADLEFNETRKRRISKPRYIPLELQKLFAKMKLLDQDSISTEGCISLLSFNSKIFITDKNRLDETRFSMAKF